MTFSTTDFAGSSWWLLSGDSHGGALRDPGSLVNSLVEPGHDLQEGRLARVDAEHADLGVRELRWMLSRTFLPPG